MLVFCARPLPAHGIPNFSDPVSRRAERTILLTVDALALSLAFLLHYMARFEWQWFGPPSRYPEAFLAPLLLLNGFWLFGFAFFGLYRERYAASRFDELASLFKVVTVGVLVLVFAIYIESFQPGSSRAVIFFYWAAAFSLVALGRILVRSVQKALILRGKGLHRVLIVGWSDRVESLHQEVARYPAAGLEVVGAVRMHREAAPEAVIAGKAIAGEALPISPSGDGFSAPSPEVLADVRSIEALPRLIDELDVQDVLIALGSEDHTALTHVLQQCDGTAASLKLVPDFYTVIGGMARTEHLYGLPLIEVLPEPMPAWEASTKRLVDVVVALAVLAGAFPLWVALALLVRFTSPGSIIYRQQRVGQHGRPFTMYKFRTMHRDAEATTGPVWATKEDPRYTPLGRWLRKLRLDEVPQLVNVLKGEMSLIGPRPERPYFVDQLVREIPLYSRRHRVKPGITGLAQVKWKYDTSLEDVRQKVKYDLFYIENMSLRMDCKILLRTVQTALLGRGQ